MTWQPVRLSVEEVTAGAEHYELNATARRRAHLELFFWELIEAAANGGLVKMPTQIDILLVVANPVYRELVPRDRVQEWVGCLASYDRAVFCNGRYGRKSKGATQTHE